MKRLLLLLLVPALLAAFTLPSDTSYSKGPPVKVLPEYMALGDSLAVGVGASDTPPFPSTSNAYVPLVHAFLQSELGLDTDLNLNNLGVGGEDTNSMRIEGGQLDTALAELEARNGDKKRKNDVEVITLDIGGNDVLGLLSVCGGGFTQDCADAISSTFATFSGNFNFILGELRSAAGPDTTIIVMTYYNALEAAGCPLNALAPLGDIVLEGEPLLGLPVGLNDLIRFVAAAHGAEVADTFGRLSPDDIQPDCIHANDVGYAEITEQFIEAFDD